MEPIRVCHFPLQAAPGGANWAETLHDPVLLRQSQKQICVHFDPALLGHELCTPLHRILVGAVAGIASHLSEGDNAMPATAPTHIR